MSQSEQSLFGLLWVVLGKFIVAGYLAWWFYVSVEGIGLIAKLLLSIVVFVVGLKVGAIVSALILLILLLILGIVFGLISKIIDLFSRLV